MEMFIPAIGTGVEQGHQISCSGIARGDIRPLPAIAAETGIRQILQRARTAVLLTYDMVLLMWGEYSFLRDPTVFAAVTGTTGNSTSECGRDCRHSDSLADVLPWARARISETMSSSKII
jgi:hypothetical protein